MNMVITMAGKSQRFKDKGIEIPKWKIQIDDKEMLYWSLYPFRSLVRKIVFVTNRFDCPLQILGSVCKNLSISNYEIVELDETPNGQALSASSGLNLLPHLEPFAIWNIDTLICPKQELNIPTDGFWLSLTKLPGDSWSFARFEEAEIVEIVEKRRISDWASIGLYGFPSPSKYLEGLNAFLSKHNTPNGEIFVAPLYEYWLNQGQNVAAHFVSNEEIVPLGTPEDMLNAHRMGKIKVQSEILMLLKG